MTFAMRYICEKANPKNIVAYGFTMAKGGLGVFDTEKYQEVTGELPPGSTMKPPESTTTDPQPAQPDLTKMTSAQLIAYVAQLQTQITAVQTQLTKQGLGGLLGK